MEKDWAQELTGKDVTGRDIIRLQDQVRRLAVAGESKDGKLIVTADLSIVRAPALYAPPPKESRQRRRARHRREKKDAASREKAQAEFERRRRKPK